MTDKPPPDPEVFELSSDDMPEGLADAISQAMEQAMLPMHVDHGFIIERSRAAGFDAKRLRVYYPSLPTPVLEAMLKRRVTIDARGVFYELH